MRPFPDVSDGRWQVSSGGGREPSWSRRGSELFYVASDGSLMSVRFDAGPVWNAHSPVVLFRAPEYFQFFALGGRTYDVSADGARFLVAKAAPSSSSARSIVLVQNWGEELKRLVPVK